MIKESEPPFGAIDLIEPWTIEAISSEARDLAIAAACAENLTTGQWLARRIYEWTITGGPLVRADGNALTLTHDSSPPPSRTDCLNMENLKDIVAIAKELAVLGGQPSDNINRAIEGVLNRKLRALSGRPRRRKGD